MKTTLCLRVRLLSLSVLNVQNLLSKQASSPSCGAASACNVIMPRDEINARQRRQQQQQQHCCFVRSFHRWRESIVSSWTTDSSLAKVDKVYFGILLFNMMMKAKSWAVQAFSLQTPYKYALRMRRVHLSASCTPPSFFLTTAKMLLVCKTHFVGAEQHPKSLKNLSRKLLLLLLLLLLLAGWDHIISKKNSNVQCCCYLAL